MPHPESDRETSAWVTPKCGINIETLAFPSAPPSQEALCVREATGRESRSPYSRMECMISYLLRVSVRWGCDEQGEEQSFTGLAIAFTHWENGDMFESRPVVLNPVFGGTSLQE